MTVIIDGDTHVCEPKDVFTSRMPSKYGDRIPHVKYMEDEDADFWFVGDKPVFMVSGSVIYNGPDGSYVRKENFAGAGTAGYEMFPRRFEEQHPSAYDPNERVKVMDEFGIQSATTYPSLGLVNPDIYRTGGPDDLEFQMALVRAYNDWIMTWATEQPGRFIPLGGIPYWDVDSAVKEIVRCADIGIKGMVMSGVPEKHGAPILHDPVWNPMWAAAQDAGLSISFHAGGAFTRDDYHSRVMGWSALQACSSVVAFLGNAISAVEVLYSGILQRFPRLNFAIVESGVGWTPFVLDAADQFYKRYRLWDTRPEMKADELPSDLFRRQMFVNTWYEPIDAHARNTWPIDNLIFETDYPHPTCLIGDEIAAAIETTTSALTPEERDKVLYKNAMRCFNLSYEDIGLKGEV